MSVLIPAEPPPWSPEQNVPGGVGSLGSRARDHKRSLMCGHWESRELC